MATVLRTATIYPVPRRKKAKLSEEYNNVLLSTIFPTPFILGELDRAKQIRKLKFDQEINKFYNEPLPFVLVEPDRLRVGKKVILDKTLFNLSETTLIPAVSTVPFYPTITLDRFNRTRKINYVNLFVETPNVSIFYPAIPAPEDTLLSLNIGLNIGNPTKIADAIVATGTARVSGFSVIGPPVQHKVTIYQKGATVLSGNIEITTDAGTTWVVLAAFNFITNPVIAFEVSPGIIYRLNVAALTASVSADIFAVLG